MAWWALYKKYFPVIMCLLTIFFFANLVLFFWGSFDNHWKRKRLLLHVQAILSRCLVHCILKINNCTNADNLGKFIAIWYKNLSCVLEWAGRLDLEFLFLLARGVMRWLIFKFSCCFNYHFFCYIYGGTPFLLRWTYWVILKTNWCWNGKFSVILAIKWLE